MPNKILVPVDGSEDARKAIEFAVNMAKQENATINFLHVVNPAYVPARLKAKIDWKPYLDHHKEVGDQILKEAKDEGKKKGIKYIETAMMLGDPAEKIVSYAKEHHFDMIVMGSRGLGSPKGPGLGSVASQVSHAIDQTCIIVRKKLLDGRKILVVDDEPDVLDTLEELLSVCEIVKATTFDAAKELLETRDFDMVILDIMGVDGYKLLEIANEKRVLPVMLTARALGAENVMKSFKNGAASFVPKEKMANITIFLEDILEAREKGKHFWWRWFERLGHYFEKNF